MGGGDLTAQVAGGRRRDVNQWPCASSPPLPGLSPRIGHRRPSGGMVDGALAPPESSRTCRHNPRGQRQLPDLRAVGTVFHPQSIAAGTSSIVRSRRGYRQRRSTKRSDRRSERKPHAPGEGVAPVPRAAGAVIRWGSSGRSNVPRRLLNLLARASRATAQPFDVVDAARARRGRTRRPPCPLAHRLDTRWRRPTLPSSPPPAAAPTSIDAHDVLLQNRRHVVVQEGCPAEIFFCVPPHEAERVLWAPKGIGVAGREGSWSKVQ